MKKNNTIDFAAWGLVLVILLATPFIVNVFHTAPELGPDKRPTVLIMVLTLLGFLTITSLTLWAQILLGRTRSLSARDSLAPTTLNTMNLHNKLLGGLLILSGFVKLQDPVGFSIKLKEYWTVFAQEEYLGSLFPAGFFVSITTFLAIFISVLEVVLAFALMTGWKIKLTSTITLLLMLFFTGLTFFSAYTGEVTDCGCFGDALKLTPWQSFYKDVWLLPIVLPIFLLRKRIKPYYARPIPAIAVLIAAIGFTYVSYHSLNHLPPLDFRGAYKVGQDLEYNGDINNLLDDGQPIAPGYEDFCKACGKDQTAYEGATLYVIAYAMEEHPRDAYEKAVQLAKDLKKDAPGIKVCGGTNTGSSARRKMAIADLDLLCLSPQDEKVLKTMIRSSPGYIFLKDGIVQKKWHYNDQPSVEDLRELAGVYADQVPEPEPAPALPDSLTVDTTVIDTPGN